MNKVPQVWLVTVTTEIPVLAHTAGQAEQIGLENRNRTEAKFASAERILDPEVLQTHVLNSLPHGHTDDTATVRLALQKSQADFLQRIENIAASLVINAGDSPLEAVRQAEMILDVDCCELGANEDILAENVELRVGTSSIQH